MSLFALCFLTEVVEFGTTVRTSEGGANPCWIFSDLVQKGNESLSFLRG